MSLPKSLVMKKEEFEDSLVEVVIMPMTSSFFLCLLDQAFYSFLFTSTNLENSQSATSIHQSDKKSLTTQTPFRQAIFAVSIKHADITFFEGEVNQSKALIPPDLKMGHLGFFSNLQEPLPLPKH